jgi:hypothetical protein
MFTGGVQGFSKVESRRAGEEERFLAIMASITLSGARRG